MNAYIVQGVGESTGCRFMTDILIKCGCHGTSGHTQEFQSVINNKQGFINQIKNKQYDNLVCRFSYPHGKYRPDIKDFYERLKTVYDKVYIILTTRSWVCQYIGTEKGNHLKNNPIEALPTVEDRVTMAYKDIFSQLIRIEDGFFTDFIVVNMGDLIAHTEANIKFLIDKIDLKIPPDFDYNFIQKDADLKRVKEYLKNN